MVQVQGYICYTLFNILCIITLNIIIINSHNSSIQQMRPVNIMVQVQGYICYTLFNILCIITLNIIIINSHNSSIQQMRHMNMPHTICIIYTITDNIPMQLNGLLLEKTFLSSL